MDSLVILQGPQTGKRLPLEQDCTVLGRQSDSTICLESLAVSRHHARILKTDDKYFVEDLGSSNGTYLNGIRVTGRLPLKEHDRLQVGPYLLDFQRTPMADPGDDTALIVREQVSVLGSNPGLYDHNPTQKLQVVLEIAQHLARTLDIDELLGKLLEHLLRLFPQADRGLVLLCEGDRLAVHAQRCRRAQDPTTYPYSRTVVQRALDEGVGLLSEDVKADDRFSASSTITNLQFRSLLCVPLINQEAKRIGIIQLERSHAGSLFRSEDLHMLSTIGLQVVVALENAELHVKVLREERLRQEVAMAREIQQGFLPNDFPVPDECGYELYASIHPARQVSGDLYDFFSLPDGRLVFLVGDVSGKGIPAAMFLVAVRTLCRHLAAGGRSPSETLTQLNDALAADNPSGMFVTLVHGFYNPASGEVVVASGGHPAPLLRRSDGRVEEMPLRSGRLIGFPGGNLGLTDAKLQVGKGETLILYTDGYIEAKDLQSKKMFELERLQDVLGGPRTKLSLADCADAARLAVERFIGSTEQQDDLTLLLLRRV